MCTPAAVIGISALQQGVEFVQQQQFVDDQAEFQAERAEAIAKATATDAIAKYSTIGRRTAEERRRTARETLQIVRAGSGALGTATAGAASGGVEGASVQALLQDFASQELTRLEISKENLTNREAQLEDQKKSVEAQASTRLFQSRPQPIQQPNLFGALFNVGITAAGQYSRDFVQGRKTKD